MLTLPRIKVIFGALLLMAASDARAAEACAACSAVEKKSAVAKGLNYFNDDDRFKGGELASEAIDRLESFSKAPASSPDRAKLFKALLELAKETAPFDGEGQLTESLALILKKDRALKKSYTETITPALSAGGPSACRAKQLDAGVQEALCLSENKVEGPVSGGAKNEKAVAKCTQKFDFEECMSKAGTSKAAAPQSASAATPSFTDACIDAMKKNKKTAGADGKAVCSCIEAGLRKKGVAKDELAVLTRHYEKKLDVEKAIEKNPSLEPLLEFETSLAGSCLKNPKFKVE